VAAPTPRIVAIGGASFGPRSTDGPLLRFMLDLTGEARPRVCLIPTASGDNAEYVANFYSTLAQHAEATHLELFGRTVEDIEGFLLDQDLVFVSGGNTANLLALWRLHGVDKVLRRAWEQGVVLAGSSAGANCWFESSVTDSFGLDLAALRDGLGILKGSFCPHYDSESLRRPRYEALVGAGDLADGYATDDGVGLLFEGRELREAVASLPGQHAYRVERRRGGSAEETQIRARLLR